MLLNAKNDRKTEKKTDKILPEGKILSCGATFSSWGPLCGRRGQHARFFRLSIKKTLGGFTTGVHWGYNPSRFF